MGRVVISEFISLDGVMEDPGGAEGSRLGGWTFQFDQGPDGRQFKLDELLAAEALLLGRTTYLGFAQAWPSMTDPTGFAEKMNGMRKYVVSSTLSDEDATWSNSVVLRGDFMTEVARLKAETEGDLLVAGSAQLARALVQHGIVDEFRLMVFPIVLGTGKKLFGESAHATTFTLAATATTESGIVMLRYQGASATRRED
jgi:dihydrofolate reductase